MEQMKPKIGDLVAISEAIVLEEIERVQAGQRRTYQGTPFAGRGQVGVVVECIGTRCRVQWSNGQKSLPQRSVLEILNIAGEK